MKKLSANDRYPAGVCRDDRFKSIPSPMLNLITQAPDTDQRMKKAVLTALVLVLAFLWAPLPATSTPPPKKPSRDDGPVVRVFPPKPPPEKPVLVDLREPSRPSPVAHTDSMPDLEPIPEFEPIEPHVQLGSDWPVAFSGPLEPSEGPVRSDHQGLKEPIITFRQKPNYPKVALSARVQGYVLVEAILGADGKIRDIKFIRSLGGGRMGFERAAIDALNAWKFLPGRLNGRPVDVLMTLRIDFKLR